MFILKWFWLAFLFLGSCSKAPLPNKVYTKSDEYVKQVRSNIDDASNLSFALSIDHSRLASKAGAAFYPTKVIFFDDDKLEADMLKVNPLVSLDLPLRVLVFQKKDAGGPRVIWNDFEYLVNRYGMPDSLKSQYDRDIQSAVAGIPISSIDSFVKQTISPSAIINLSSKYSFEETLSKALEIIRSNSDVKVFKIIDFKKKASENGVIIPDNTLIMFGAPKPGGKSMVASQTLGLDAFPQKFLVRVDESGKVLVSYNNLSAMASRQDVRGNLFLKIIQYRLDKSFKKVFDR